MLATLLVLVITVLCVAHFYLKSSAITSFATLISAILGLILAFNYYEILANMLISRGHGEKWAQPGCFILLFMVGVAVTRLLADFLTGPINFGNPIKYASAIICGVFVGLIISGAILIAIAMAPTNPKWPYPRFGAEGRAVTPASLNNPKKALLNVDSLAAGIFGWVSKGSLSSGKSFSVYHADFINQIHLNSLGASNQILSIAAKEAVTIPKNGVRMLSDNRVAVRTGIRGKEIADGGAMNEGKILFTLSQIRLICKPKAQSNDLSGTAQAYYPHAYNIAGQPAEDASDLGATIPFSRQDLKKLTAWIDVLFKVGPSMTPVLLEFKQNTVVSLPKAVASTDEIEESLNVDE